MGNSDEKDHEEHCEDLTKYCPGVNILFLPLEQENDGGEEQEGRRHEQKNSIVDWDSVLNSIIRNNVSIKT